MVSCAYQHLHGVGDNIQGRIEAVQKKIEEIEYDATLREMTDNRYSSSGAMREDIRKRGELYRQLEELEAAR